MLNSLAILTAINWAWMKFQRDKDVESAVAYGVDAYKSVLLSGGFEFSADAQQVVAGQIRQQLLYLPDDLPEIPALKA